MFFLFHIFYFHVRSFTREIFFYRKIVTECRCRIAYVKFNKHVALIALKIQFLFVFLQSRFLCFDLTVLIFFDIR